MSPPLLNIVINNLKETHYLGMLEVNHAEILDKINSIIANWEKTGIPYKDFGLSMLDVRNHYIHQFRPLQALQGQTIKIANVMRLGAFTDFWTKWLPLTDPDAIEYLALQHIENISKKNFVVNIDIENQLELEFKKINEWLKQSENGVPLSIGLILNDMDRTFWVSITDSKSNPTSQYWRDKLGLIDFGINPKDSLTTGCRELLVRITFEAELQNRAFPRENFLDYRKAYPDAMWTYRPSTLNKGNTRFVQGVYSDLSGDIHSFGKTRDLASPTYEEAESELVLFTGEEAVLSIVALECLKGLPFKKTKDEDDQLFVDIISNERGWN